MHSLVKTKKWLLTRIRDYTIGHQLEVQEDKVLAIKSNGHEEELIVMPKKHKLGLF